MKNFKVVLAILPVLILGIFMYSFAGTVAVEKTEPVTVKNTEIDKNSKVEWCNYSITLTSSSGTGCTGGNFTYCVNGGTAMSGSGGGFIASLPCGQTSVICVTTDSGCWGRIFVTPPCPCPSSEFPTYLNIEKSDRACTCQ